MQKKRKEYVLPEEIIESILKVKEEEGYKSEVAALIHIIKSYEEKKSITEEVRCISEEITDTMIQKNKAWMERVRWATKTAEVNSQILIDAINTMLLIQGVKYCSHIEYDKSPVIEQSEAKIKERISHFKQEKDNRKRKE